VNTRTTLTALAAAMVLALTGCSTSSEPVSATTATVTVDPTSATTPDDITDLVVDMTWGQQTEADKDSMCLGIGVYGPEWAAEQMRAGAGDESVDWDRSAELVAEKCADR